MMGLNLETVKEHFNQLLTENLLFSKSPYKYNDITREDLGIYYKSELANSGLEFKLSNNSNVSDLNSLTEDTELFGSDDKTYFYVKDLDLIICTTASDSLKQKLVDTTTESVPSLYTFISSYLGKPIYESERKICQNNYPLYHYLIKSNIKYDIMKTPFDKENSFNKITNIYDTYNEILSNINYDNYNVVNIDPFNKINTILFSTKPIEGLSENRYLENDTYSLLAYDNYKSNIFSNQLDNLFLMALNEDYYIMTNSHYEKAFNIFLEKLANIYLRINNSEIYTLKNNMIETTTKLDQLYSKLSFWLASTNLLNQEYDNITFIKRYLDEKLSDETIINVLGDYVLILVKEYAEKINIKTKDDLLYAEFMYLTAFYLCSFKKIDISIVNKIKAVLESNYNGMKNLKENYKSFIRNFRLNENSKYFTIDYEEG